MGEGPQVRRIPGMRNVVPAAAARAPSARPSRERAASRKASEEDPKPSPKPEAPKSGPAEPEEPKPEPVKDPEPQVLPVPAAGKVSKASGTQAVRTASGVRIKRCREWDAKSGAVKVEVECWNGSDWEMHMFSVKEKDPIGELIPAKGSKPQMDYRTHWILDSVGGEEERECEHPVPGGPSRKRKDKVQVLTLRHEWAKDPKFDEFLECEMWFRQQQPVPLPLAPPESERPPEKPPKKIP